jgi:hypothetical protein
MDADTDQGLSRRPGGIVEPANRAAVAKERFQTTEEVVTERYELHDPFAEVTYRLRTIPDIVAKAEQLGSTRFQAVDASGKHSQIYKVAGVWQRADGRALLLGPQPVKSESERATNVVPLIATASSPEACMARIDADAERAAHVQRLEAALNERYVIKRASVKLGDVTIGQTEYRYRGDTSRVAFTESTFKLATDNNSPSVARSMVDVAEARNWQALRVSGNEDFKRLVWLEASLRGVKTLGYEPHHADLQLLQKEREARQTNRIEPLPSDAGAATTKQSARGSGGRKAVLAALEAVLVGRRVPAKQREAVMNAAAEKLAQRLRDGQTHKVKVFDKTTPSQRPAVMPTREMQRTRERASPVR